MLGMTFRRHSTLITHTDDAHIPSPLMPGYSGHVPTTKFQYGITFGNATTKYFQDVRCAAMAYSASPLRKGGMFPSIYSNTGRMITTERSQSRGRSLYNPYWARYNVDFNRQTEIRRFDELAQKHRENYIDRTGTLRPVSYFILPVKETERFLQARTRDHSVIDIGINTITNSAV